MKQSPQLIFADDLLDNWCQREIKTTSEHTTSTCRWVLNRPLSCGNIFTRLRLAWKVFTGECDALKWNSQ